MGKSSRIRKERKDAEGRTYLTRAQIKAANKEASRRGVEIANQFFRNEAAVILYALHQIFGFGPKRLKRFFLCYKKCHEDLCAWYACNAEEDGYDIGDYLSRLELKKIGVDFDAWEKEVFGQSDNGKKL